MKAIKSPPPAARSFPNRQKARESAGKTRKVAGGNVVFKARRKPQRKLVLWAAVGSIIAALILKAIDKHHDSTFVGQWAPTFLLLGIYNKLVKQHGSDRSDR